MPTISQLPPAQILSPEDEIPISQGGSVCSISVGNLLAGTQPTIIIPSPSLLGRSSAGAGGGEAIEIGTGFGLLGGTIIATGADHAEFPSAPALIVSSSLVICDQGMQKLMPTATLRSLFSAGDNIAIDANGIISASSTVESAGGDSLGSIANLQITSSPVATDLVPISQSGTAYSIAYSNFLNGLTIDQAVSAAPAAGTDMVWVSQSSNSMTAQSFSAIWSWIAANLPQYRPSVLEVGSNIILSYDNHNGRILAVTEPNITITPNSALMGNGFGCEILTWEDASVTWGAGVLATDGGLGLSGNSYARLLACSTSRGIMVLASVCGPSSINDGSVAAPGPISNLVATGQTSSSLTVSWTAPTTGGVATYYVVQYRLSGTSTWAALSANPTSSAVSITGLASATAYDVQVAATNSGGVSSAYLQISNMLTAAAAVVIPGAPSGLAIGVSTASSVALSWVSSAAGGSPTGYVIQYSINGGTTWSLGTSFGMVTSGVLAGLQATTSYVFRIAAINAAGSSAYVPTSSYPGTTTSPSAMPPGLPTNLTFPLTYSTSMTAQWTAPSGSVSSYNIQYRVANAPSWTVVSSGAPSITIAGLLPGTTYEFQVQAVNGSVVGAFTASTMNTTTAATTSGAYKLTPAPTRQSPTQGWTGTTIARANGQPASGYNVSDNSAAADGGSPVPASVGFAWSASNTVVPAVTNAGSSGLSLDGHNLWYSWSVTYPNSAGNYYLWAIALDSGGNVGGTCVSPTPFTLQ